MKTVDGKKVFVYAPEDEKPHTPGPEVNWQESVVLYWYDEQQHLGGFFRLAHEPNSNGGETSFVITVFAPGVVFRRTEKLPLRDSDKLENGFNNGDDSLVYEYDGEKIYWSLQQDDIDLRLVVDPFVPPIDAHRKEGEYSGEDILSAHIDAACGVKGSFTIRGNSYQVNAIGVRDHAWGNRDLSTLLSYRWLIGTFDEQNSFVAMTFLSTANKPTQFGWVIRGDTVIMAEKVNVKAIIGEDGATIFGGNLQMTLTTGEVFEVKFDPILPSFGIFFVFLHPTFYHDCLCRISWGDKRGFGVFEGTNNIRGGTIRPETFVGSIGADGWHEGVQKLLP